MTAPQFSFSWRHIPPGKKKKTLYPGKNRGMIRPRVRSDAGGGGKIMITIEKEA
jgi:hypothetical protein